MANSKIYLGTTNIGSIFGGAADVSIYLGTEKVYPLGKKLIATYSDSSTYDVYCNEFDRLGQAEVSASTQPVSAMTDAVVGECVTGLQQSFYECTSLSSVTIPDTVTSFSGQVFGYCESLKSVDLPSGLTNISSYCFAQSGIESITLPSSITYIGMYAFSFCNSLSGMTLEGTTPPELEQFALYDVTCPIYVPCEAVEAYKAASGWSEVASQITCIEPPMTNKKLRMRYSGGTMYEANCDASSAITSADTHPNGYDFSKMRKFVIGDCVTELGDSAFVNLPNEMSNAYYGKTLDLSNITTFGETVFTMVNGQYNFNFGTMILRDVTLMKDGALASCKGNFVIDNVTPPSWSLSSGIYPMPPAYSNYNIYVPDSAVATYKANSNWRNFSSIIKGISEMPS